MGLNERTMLSGIARLKRRSGRQYITGVAAATTNATEEDDEFFVIPPGSGTHTIALPLAAVMNGMMVFITSTTNAVGTVTISFPTDDPNAATVLTDAGGYLLVMSIGHQWVKLAEVLT